jgi:hypothetical protein
LESTRKARHRAKGRQPQNESQALLPFEFGGFVLREFLILKNIENIGQHKSVLSVSNKAATRRSKGGVAYKHCRAIAIKS